MCQKKCIKKKIVNASMSIHIDIKKSLTNYEVIRDNIKERFHF